MKLIFLFFLYGLMTNTFSAELKEYKSTDNQGLTKVERIDKVESYLADIAKAIKETNTRFDAIEKKFSTLDSSILIFRNEFQQLSRDVNEFKKNGSKKSPKLLDEKNKDQASISTETPTPEDDFKKLKEEFDNLKTKDLEKIRSDLNKLKTNIDELQISTSTK